MLTPKRILPIPLLHPGMDIAGSEIGHVLASADCFAALDRVQDLQAVVDHDIAFAQAEGIEVIAEEVGRARDAQHQHVVELR